MRVSNGLYHQNRDEDQRQQTQYFEENREAARGGVAFAAVGAPLGTPGNRLQAAMADFPRLRRGCSIHRPCAHYTTGRRCGMPPVIIESCELAVLPS